MPTPASRPSIKQRGPWIYRVLILGFSVLLAVLASWLFRFMISDMDRLPAPDYGEIERRVLDSERVAELEAVRKEIADSNRRVNEQRQRQAVLRDSTESSQKTMNQLLDLQRLSLQQGVALSESERQALDESKTLFLSNQRRYQELNEGIAVLEESLRTLESRQRALDAELESQKAAARLEFNGLRNRWELKVAALKLGILIPLLVGVVWLFRRAGGGLYAPLIYAVGFALIWRVGWVIHQHFPGAYFKYILLAVALALVVFMLISLLRMIAFPREEWLIKQYKESYERFMCPICAYPIRRGALKYAYWTRRSVTKLRVPPATDREPEHPYSCPACGTTLHEECSRCGGIRHSLLPVCDRCGEFRSIAPPGSGQGEAGTVSAGEKPTTGTADRPA